MHLRLVFDSQEQLKCGFLSIVVKNRSLATFYPGGVRRFIERFSSRCNRSLTVFNGAGQEFNDLVMTLEAHGLREKIDFVIVDVFDYEWSLMFNPESKDTPRNVNMGVAWLTGRYAGGSIYVWTGRGVGKKASTPPRRGHVFKRLSVDRIFPSTPR
jgi:hypothetical protein